MKNSDIKVGKYYKVNYKHKKRGYTGLVQVMGVCAGSDQGYSCFTAEQSAMEKIWINHLSGCRFVARDFVKQVDKVAFLDAQIKSLDKKLHKLSLAWAKEITKTVDDE